MNGTGLRPANAEPTLSAELRRAEGPHGRTRVRGERQTPSGPGGAARAIRAIHHSIALSLVGVLALSGCVADFSDSSERRTSELATASVVLDRAVAEAADDFNFGPHAVDQCDNPIATVSNSGGTFGAANTILARGADGNCRSEKGYCIGDCVRVVVKDGGKQSDGVNVIAGSALPDPGTCSEIAVDTNDPAGSWDFSHAGACGKGASGDGYWHNCFVHDVCVWARCTDDDLIAGGLSIVGEGGIDDEFCGKAFDDARKDFVYANILISCLSDSMCPEGTDCKSGTCRQEGLPEGSVCFTDADCDGYCQFLRCWNGSRGDKCRTTSDCQGGLQCKKRCRVCAQKTCQ